MSASAEPYRKTYSPEKAALYVQSKDENPDTNRAECALVRRAFAGIARGSRVLDLPCGGGRMTVLLSQLGYEMEAADISPSMVDLTRARLVQEQIDAPVSRQDLESTTFADRQFDAVLCFRMFHHFPTLELRERATRELCRIVSSCVVVSYLDARSWTSRRRALQARFAGKPANKFSQTPQDCAALFTAQGFKVVADLARFPLFHSLRVLVARRT